LLRRLLSEEKFGQRGFWGAALKIVGPGQLQRCRMIAGRCCEGALVGRKTTHLGVP
jgi:hypothetical protein